MQSANFHTADGIVVLCWTRMQLFPSPLLPMQQQQNNRQQQQQQQQQGRRRQAKRLGAAAFCSWILGNFRTTGAPRQHSERKRGSITRPPAARATTSPPVISHRVTVSLSIPLLSSSSNIFKFSASIPEQSWYQVFLVLFPWNQAPRTPNFFFPNAGAIARCACSGGCCLLLLL